MCEKLSVNLGAQMQYALVIKHLGKLKRHSIIFFLLRIINLSFSSSRAILGPDKVLCCDHPCWQHQMYMDHASGAYPRPSS